MSPPGDETYFLRTSRLGFRTWTEDDLDLAAGLWGDERVAAPIGGPFTEAEVRDRLADEIALQESHGIQYWPVFRLDDGTHVGCCGLRPREPDAGVLELGFHIRHEHWRRGYASEAARVVIRHAFDLLGARALFAGHHPENEPSRRLLLNLGFRHTHDELYPPTGREHPSYLLARKAAAEPGGAT